jgi:hypothetical protein
MSSDAAGDVALVLSVDEKPAVKGFTAAGREADRLANKVKAAGHGTVSSMQAASASIRLLENPLGNNVRAIERLISQSKVLSGVMKAAFPVVGAIAIGSIVLKAGKEIAEFIEKVNKMPKAIELGFASMHLASVSSTDALKLTNAELENSIAKLQGKPQNNLAIALAESRIKADELAKSLENDASKVKELLTANNIGSLASLLGKASTSSVAGSVNSFQDKLRDLGFQRNDLVHSGDQSKDPALKAKIDAVDREYVSVQSSYNAWVKDQLAVRTKFSSGAPGAFGTGVAISGKTYQDMAGDQGANINILRGVQQVQYDSADKQSTENTNATDVAEKKKLEADDAARKAALEAAKKAAAAQMAQWEEDHSNWKAVQDRSLLEDAAWWKAKLDILTTKSLNYKAVLQKRNADIIEQNKQDMEAMKKFQTEYMEEFQKTGGMSKDDDKSLDQAGNASAARITAMRQMIDMNKLNSDAVSEASLKMAVNTGQMTKQAAAQALQTMHTQDYTEALQKLQDVRAAIESDPQYNDHPEARQAALLQNTNQTNALNTSRNIQSAQDSQAVNPEASSAVVGAKDALNDFANAAQNSAKQMREIIDKTLGGLNENIVKAAFGQKTDFRGMGLNLAKEGTGTMLNKAEGSAMNLVGFGGAGAKMGSKGKPMYVIIADGLKAMAGSAGSAIGKVGGSAGGSTGLMGMLNDSNFASGLFGGKLFGAGGIFQGGFAAGGDVVPNQMMLVGEHGPELMVPKSHATIIPNHKLGGTTHYHTNHNNYGHTIDARGSTDPKATEAAVRRALPQAVSASVSVQHQRAMRTPQKG